jgi:thymidine phosphorylase
VKLKEIIHVAGFVENIEASTIGQMVLTLGGGRLKKTDIIDHSVGFDLVKIRGEKIDHGNVWINVHHSRPLTNEFIEKLQSALKTVAVKPAECVRVFKILEKID